MKKFLFTLTVGLLAVFFLKPSFADDVTTSVTVGNSAPSFTVAPAENPASDNTTPTDVGSNVTFQATGTDNNSEDYYLAICQTDAITPGAAGAAPTCDGGSFCISSATASTVQSTCNYAAQSGDSENEAWFAFVCDDNTSSACSDSSQGSGSSGSPFSVNHAPSFTVVGNDGPKNPGEDVTWTTTASDSDTAGTSDTVKLLVCASAGISGGACTGTQLCASSFVASDPSCAYSIPNPSVGGSIDAFVYVVDNHNFPASGGVHGTQSDFTISNVAPVVTAVTINGGSDITLTENSTTAITVTGTVTDNNSCTDIASVETSVYRSAVTYAGCDINAEDNNNSCYAQVSCSVVGGGNTCTGTSDASADYTCSVSIQYHADPTDTATIYVAENWLSTLVAEDTAAASDATEVSAGVEMNSLIAYNVSSSIAYGSLGTGESNDPLDKITTITATGNVGLDEELDGDDMCTDYPTCAGDTIVVGQQEYALASSTAYGAGTSLTGTPAEAELNCPKTISTGSPETADTWWGLEVPLGTAAGSYTGQNTIVAVKGETAGW
jgi:hypothetical protein